MTIAILLSGGTGTRIGGQIPKQYIEVEGKPIIVYCLETLNKSNYIEKIQIVADKSWVPNIKKWAMENGVSDKIIGYSSPGENRQLSIYNALVDIVDVASDEDYVFVHDAARPMLSVDSICEYIEGMAGYDGVIPVLAMKDTVYLSKDGTQIDSLLNRSEIYAGQAPEVFVYGKYCQANQRLVDTGEIAKINGATEPAVKAGMKMHMIPGDEKNFKITTGEDLDRFVELMRER